jgi:uncharacterized membrane protein YphA (DoxX/SURF4 family)
MERFLDRLHARARAIPAFQRLAVISRILLGLAFIPTGLVKLLGERFTILGLDSPVGLFFEAMYRSGGYWNFIGTAQVLAGVLLLIPATTTLGAVLFFPIILNIFVITVSLHFQGTPFITGPMLLASVFLLCWDYDRLKFVLFPSTTRSGGRIRLGRLESSGYALGTAAGLGVFLWTRGFVGPVFMRVCLGLGMIAVLIVLAAWIRAMRPSPAGMEAT